MQDLLNELYYYYIFSLFHVSTFSNVAVSYFTRWLVHTRDGTGQDFLDPTGKFQNHRRLTGFLPKVFLHYSMYLMKNFQKGGHGWGIKNLILDGGLRKTSNPEKRKKILAFFCVFQGWKFFWDPRLKSNF